MKQLITVNKPINLEQLDKEFNGKGLVANINDQLEVASVGLADDNDGLMDDLQKCIDNHNAIFPKPTLEEKLMSMGLDIDDLKKLGL